MRRRPTTVLCGALGMRTTSLAIASLAVVLVIILGAWRSGPQLWDWAALSVVGGDEGRELVYESVGRFGGDKAFRYLSDALAAEVQVGANDVVLSGIIRGIVQTEDPMAADRLARLFHSYSDSGRNRRRFIAVHAAIGLKALDPEAIPSAIARGSAYSYFGISDYGSPASEISVFEERFSSLREQVSSAYPQQSMPTANAGDR